MQIKRQELEKWHNELGEAYAQISTSHTPMKKAIWEHVESVWSDIGRILADPDPVDAVPVCASLSPQVGRF